MCLNLAFANNILTEMCHSYRKLDTAISVLEKNADIEPCPWGKVEYLRMGCKMFHAQQPSPPKASWQKVVGMEMFIESFKQGNVCSQGPLTRTFP